MPLLRSFHLLHNFAATISKFDVEKESLAEREASLTGCRAIALSRYRIETSTMRYEERLLRSFGSISEIIHLYNIIMHIDITL